MFKIRTYCYLVITLNPALPLIATPSIPTTMTLPQAPLQSKSYVAPNVMLLIDNSGSMKKNPDKKKKKEPPVKMTIAKEVAIGVIEANPDVRFCLSKFNDRGLNGGAEIVVNCQLPVVAPGQTQSPIVKSINTLTAEAWTPLAEAYYEVIRYFAGMSSAYNTGVNYSSPIQYRCQKNFTIVLTDGRPYQELSFPLTGDMEDVLPISSQNYDVTDDDNPESKRTHQSEWLDDFAKYAWDADLKPLDVNDDAGKSYEDPDIVAGGEPGRQNMHTYTLGFAVDHDMLSKAADNGHGTYYTADDATELSAALGSALNDINSKSQSISAIASSSNLLVPGTDLNVYQSRYIGGAWTGELVAWTLDPTTLQFLATPAWRAPLSLSANGWQDRVIFSGYNNGIEFRISNFSNDDFETWFREGSSNLVPYFRGKPASTITANALRPRDSLLGDVINSSPVYVAPPLKGIYRDDAFSGGEAYSDFVEKYKDRTKMLFVGANDGMLHGYNAADGNELLGFYPAAVLPNLRALADPDYDHQFYVDGTPTVSPVYDPSSKTWRTLLVGGLRRGGQSIYALDISNPDLFTTDAEDESAKNAAEVVRWEFGDADDADMGYSYSQPKSMRLGDGKFYTVLGNGYNSTEDDGNASTTGDAVLYLLNVKDGSVDDNKKISTQVGTAEDPTGRGIGNGLSTVTGFDATNDGKIDYLYAGDLFGNVWKFDVSNPDSSKWGGATMLFTACGDDTCETGTTNNNHQPITTAIEVAKTEYGKIMLFFGTGKFLELADTLTANIAKQSFYGLIDDNSIPITSRTELKNQKILFSGKPTIAGVTFASDIRVTTDYPIEAKKGWFMDIQVPVYGVDPDLEDKINGSVDEADYTYAIEGEQILAKARYSKGVVSFFTKSASSAVNDPCSDLSSNSFAMELDALSGSRLASLRSDVNGDGLVDEKDSIDTGKKNTLGDKILAVVSGKAVGNGSGNIDITVTDSNGNLTDKVISINGPGNATDSNEDNVGKIIKTGYRVSWREITND